MNFHGIKLHSLKYPPNMLALCWHSTPAYHAFYYVGIFVAGLAVRLVLPTYIVFSQCILDSSTH